MVGRRCDNVGTVATKPFSEAHFAVYPPALITPCILAGCPVGGTVLDPFAGSGTTCKMAKLNGRNYIGIDIAEEYVEMARRRVEKVAG
jgi:DNA modification methylase